MRDLYNLHKFYNNGKSSKQLNNRGKSFGYQVLGFGSGGVAVTVIDPNQRGIFFGGVNGGYQGVTNLVSDSGTVASDTAAVGTARFGGAGASYGIDKGIFVYGWIGSYSTISNLVNNLGVVASDTTSIAGTGKYKVSGATYGGDKAIFAYGGNP